MPSEYANDLMARVGLDTTDWKKGITDLNAGIKHIETGFQATAALMDDWGNSSEGLKKRVESLNDKLALQKQKLDILKKAYEEEVAANGEGSKAAEELAKKMYAAKNEIDRTKASVDLYSKKLDDMAVISDKTAKKLETFANKTKTLSTVAAAGLAAIGAGLVKVGQNADELNTLAKQTGLTTEEIQKFKYASDLIDVELEDVTGALRKMTKNMISTSSEVKSAWDTLGVSTKNAAGETKGVTDVFYEVLAALSKVKNETERDQLAMLLFGKSANDLAGIVDDGGAALRELGGEAENLGLIMSQDAIDGANEFNDVIDKLKANVNASLGKAFSENAAELTEVAEDVAGALVSVVNAIADAPPWMTKTTLAITGLAAVLSPLLTVSSKTVSAMVKLKAAYKAKTAATAESTAAETTHSSALAKTTATSATATKGIKGLGTAMKAATPYILAVAAALLYAANAIKKFEDKRKAQVEVTYQEFIEEETKKYNLIIENLEKEQAAYEEAQLEKINNTNDYYDAEIELLDDKLDATKKSIEAERKLYKKAHEERLKQLEAEKKLKLSNIDIEESAQISVIQQQIDAINALTEADKKAQKKRENDKKLAELKNAINSANTYAEKVDAENEYSEFLREIEQERVEEQRESQIKELENQIKIIEKESDAKRNQVEEEYDIAVENENNIYELAEEGFNNRLDLLDGYIESETEKLNTARDKKLSILQKETADYNNEIQKRIDKNNELLDAEVGRLEKEKQNEIENPDWTSSEYAEALNDATFEMDDWYDYLSPVKWGYKIGEAILGNANGTDYWHGGLTRINEEGGEILNLPRGTQIIPHDVSMEMARASGAQAANTTTTNNSTTNNSYNYGARQQVNVFQIGNKTVAKAIVPAASVIMSDNIYGRRRSGGEIKRI